MTQKILLWFRNDLRLHDNEALATAIDLADEIVLVYVFDARKWADTKYGFKKTGIHRTKFLIESVENLRQNIEKLGGNLIVEQGIPEEIVSDLANKHKVSSVFFQKEHTSEEIEVEQKLIANLKTHNIKTKSFEGMTLFHPNNLPFSTQRIPELFTEFRKNVENKSNVEPLFDTPTKLQTPFSATKIPTLSQLGFESNQHQKNPNAVLDFKGGETEALNHLHSYLWTKDLLKTYKDTRNGLLGADYSSKISVWLANGSLSARHVYWEIKRYENQRISNQSTYWLVFELLWRDYFRFIAQKHGNLIFKLHGIQQKPKTWQWSNYAFDLWATGKTKIPFVDANMKELLETGFMSNRGRQNVASYLTKDLKIDWRAGAAWFESMLIDYDVCSNYGNWTYAAGVGNDPREDRYFNITKQAQMYDPKGDYVRHWL